MASRPILRLLAMLAAIAGVAFATLAGAPWGAALLALLGGAAAAFLWLGRNRETPRLATEEGEPSAPGLPDAAALLGATDQPLLIVREGRVLVANSAARRVLGQHIEGSDVRLAIRHPAAAERLAKGRGEAGQSDGPIELVGLGDQERRWEMATATVGIDTILVRLTDRSDAFAAEQMRSDFVANASHELRTPLATLLGFLETLQDESAASDKKTRSRFLNIMFDEARRMQQLVEDLMSLSRIEAERFSLPRETVDLLPLVREAESNLRQLLEEKESRVEVEAEGGPFLVAGDRPQLVQLIMNLMENGIRYGRRGTPVTVKLAEAASSMFCFSVADQGEGVAPEHLPHLTRRFYRVDEGRSRAEGGTGLGLAIVKHIVGRHRGRLDIASRVGEGTIVRVYLPRAPRAGAAVTKESR